MADPFEVRVRFSAQLQNLNASVTSARKAAAYALKYRDLDEDLHSCILEQLEKPQTALNTRANIMYFIEHFLELAQREGHNEYVAMIQRDIIRVVDAVAPESGQGAANVKVVRRVLQGLQQRGFLDGQVVTEIEEVLREREADLLRSPGGVGVGGPNDMAGHPGNGGGGRDEDAMDVDPQDRMAPSQTMPSGGGVGGGHAGDGSNGNGHVKGNSSNNMIMAGGSIVGFGSAVAAEGPRGLDKKQIEERIEEDRERHKRLRENIWAVPGGTDTEMWKIWEETSELGEDDHVMGEEEQAERSRNLLTSCRHGEPVVADGRR